MITCAVANWLKEADEMDGSHQRRDIARRLREKLKDMKGQCIVQHPSFHKVVLDSEIVCCWAYGHLGLGKRYELPACVRAAIMAEYPSNTGNYVGFKRTSDKDPPLECE
ncbi:hypothetical protein COOONC_12054 [Cooperia oncophora]